MSTITIKEIAFIEELSITLPEIYRAVIGLQFDSGPVSISRIYCLITLTCQASIKKGLRHPKRDHLEIRLNQIGMRKRRRKIFLPAAQSKI